MPAQITDDLRSIIESRKPARVDVLMEAVSGEGQQARTVLNEIGVTFNEATVGQKTVFEATVDAGLVDRLAEIDSLVRIDHSPTFQSTSVPVPQPGDGGYGEATDINATSLQEVINRMQVPEAWEAIGTKGEGVTVGIVDTPIDPSHPSYSSNIKGTAGKTAAEDHGTWVTSAIAADEYETPRGVIQGVAPEADIYAYGALGGGRATITSIAEGVDYCIQKECDIVNLSLGGPHSDVLQSIVEEARSEGVLPVSSAGNSGPGRATVSCPAHHSAALSVGSETTRGEAAAFSSRGPGFRGAGQKPDVMAFGGGARLGNPGLQITETVLGAAPNGGSKFLVGTSMAAPQVSGIAALRVASQREV